MQCSADANCFTETLLTACSKRQYTGVYEGGFPFWTAGQRIDPTTETKVVWRVTSSDMYDNTVYPMTFNYWQRGYKSEFYGYIGGCMFVNVGGYGWNVDECTKAFCSVCELDM